MERKSVVTGQTLPRSENERSELPRERKPLNTREKHLYVPKTEIPGYVLRIINDEDSRLARALDAFWEHVRPEEVGLKNYPESIVSWRVGTDRWGNPLTAYLMKQKQEYWEEDFALSQDAPDAYDRAIVNQSSSEVKELGQSAYRPKGGVTYKRE